ncbi:MAG: hypothetical protein ACFE0P_01395 [Oceanicaulis sp.]
MRRLLLTTMAASLVVLVACSQAELAARAASDDGQEARVRLLSGAETVRSSLTVEDRGAGAETRARRAEADEPRLTQLVHTQDDAAAPRERARCDFGKED